VPNFVKKKKKKKKKKKTSPKDPCRDVPVKRATVALSSSFSVRRPVTSAHLAALDPDLSLFPSPLSAIFFFEKKKKKKKKKYHFFIFFFFFFFFSGEDQIGGEKKNNARSGDRSMM
jgi:hypothetical protein